MKSYYIYILFLLTFGTLSCQSDDATTVTESQESKYSQFGTAFTAIPQTEDIVLYEVNIRAFSETGDLQGVIDKLDHIERLGVNVIWLMPIHPIGQVRSVNSPYSVRDYKAIGAEYGSLDDLRALTEEAHARGIAVILDWVANHTAWDNAWISNTDWYTQSADGNIIHPAGTNWQDVADLNYANKEMRAAMIDAMQYWIYEANIDGFRCDFADGVPYGFWLEAINNIRSISDKEYIFFAEGKRLDHFNAGFDLNFGWDSYGALKNVFNGQPTTQIFDTNVRVYNNTPSDKHWVRFTTNHDESAWDATPIQLFNGKKGALAASVVSIFTGGVPLIYGSQEVGAAENIPFFSNTSIDWNANPDVLRSYQTILQFYTSSDIAKRGQNIVYANKDIVCLKKRLDNEEILILVNVRNRAINFNIPNQLANTTWSDVMTQGTFSLGTQLPLAPYATYILE